MLGKIGVGVFYLVSNSELNLDKCLCHDCETKKCFYVCVSSAE